MKTLNKYLFLTCVASALLSLMLSSCKKNDSAPAATPVAMGLLTMHLHTYIDTTELAGGDSIAPNNAAKDSSGRHIALTIAKFYASNITLYKADGSTYVISNAYLLKVFFSDEIYVVGNVPVGNYTTVSFNVGLDGASNATAPSSHPVSSVLSQTSMWFGSTTQGYKFMDIEGMADTSKAGVSMPNVPFSYQLGGAAMLKTVKLPQQNFTISANTTYEVHVITDFGKLLRGVNFKTQAGTSTPFVNPAAATQIANNISGSFRYEM